MDCYNERIDVTKIISVSLAEDFIRNFWPKDEIMKYKNKIDNPKLYPKHLWYLFMIGSPNKAGG
jgi:hypothetical protein